MHIKVYQTDPLFDGTASYIPHTHTHTHTHTYNSRHTGTHTQPAEMAGSSAIFSAQPNTIKATQNSHPFTLQLSHI